MALTAVCVVVFACVLAFVEAAPVENEPDFVAQQGKALKYSKGTRRDEIEVDKAEKEAGKAVLKLLDAKIGSKVQQAASEVTDFLNGAIGKHAQARSDKLRHDKEKEISLIHLKTQKVMTHNDKGKKKKKDDSFLIHFKVPYVVTPVKKKPNKKYHHHHHHHHRHDAQHNPSKYHPYKPHPNPPPHRPAVHRAPSPYGQQPHPQQGITGQPPFNAINLNYNRNGWTYSLGNESTGMEPCQGSCTGPCTSQCSLNQGCCCCPGTTTEEPAPQFLHFPAVNSPQPAAPAPVPAAAAAATPCPPPCASNCFSYCPQQCCGMMGKRTEVPAEEGSATEAADSAEESSDNDESEADETKADPDEEEEVEDNKAAPEGTGNGEEGDDDLENKKESEENPDEV